MSTDVTIKKGTVPALAMDEATLVTVLENSLYPGAQPTSIAIVLNYCIAAGLDPMQKPVHIVPMWDAKQGRMRDVIMPGVGLYRTQAARTGQYAGVTEPEYGPDITEKIGGQEITYPAWCKVSVKRLLPNGAIVEFAATERWKENYAVKGGKEKSVAPNAMWSRRPYGQIAKCAEAQALRKAFPEMTGSQPTADEMEGRQISDEGETIDGATGEIVQKKAQEPWTAEAFAAAIKKHGPTVTAGTKTADALIAWMVAKHPLTAEQEAAVRALTPKPIEGEVLAPEDQSEFGVMSEAEMAAARARELQEAA